MLIEVDYVKFHDLCAAASAHLAVAKHYEGDPTIGISSQWVNDFQEIFDCAMALVPDNLKDVFQCYKGRLPEYFKKTEEDNTNRKEIENGRTA